MITPQLDVVLDQVILEDVDGALDALDTVMSLQDAMDCDIPQVEIDQVDLLAGLLEAEDLDSAKAFLLALGINSNI